MQSSQHFFETCTDEEYLEALRHEPVTFSVHDLVHIFPDALPAVKRNLTLHKKELSRLIDIHLPILETVLEHIHRACPSDHPQKSTILTLYTSVYFDQYIDPVKQRIDFLQRLVRAYTWKNVPSDDRVRFAREVPIASIVEPNRAGFICCPFHTEKTPSCKLYGTKFKCFGCGEHGDVIDFYMKVYGVGFTTALAKLTNS